MANGGLPQSRGPSKGKKILAYALGGIIALFLITAILPSPETTSVSASAINVSINGWKFSTDLDGWRISEDVIIQPYDSSDPDWQHPCITNSLVGSWKGQVISTPFYFPAYPNAPKDNENYGSMSAFIEDIYVVKIPEDLKKSLQDHNIGVYGSMDKIPDDVKEKDLEYILTDATRIPTMCLEWDSEENLDFKGHKAHLAKRDGDQLSSSIIAILIDEDTVAVIDSNVKLELFMKDAKAYDGRASDVIDSIIITPVSSSGNSAAS